MVETAVIDKGSSLAANKIARPRAAVHAYQCGPAPVRVDHTTSGPLRAITRTRRGTSQRFVFARADGAIPGESRNAAAPSAKPAERPIHEAFELEPADRAPNFMFLERWALLQVARR